MVHVLSPLLLERIGPYSDSVHNAFGFVKQQLRRFEEAHDDKLVRRYQRLLQYFNTYGFRD